MASVREKQEEQEKQEEILFSKIASSPKMKNDIRVCCSV